MGKQKSTFDNTSYDAGMMLGMKMASRPSPIARLLSHAMTIAALVLFAGIVYLGWPLVAAQFTGVPLPMQPTPAPATVATPRPYVPPASVPQAQPAPAQVVPTAYTLEDANRAADEAYHQAVQEAELNSVALPNASKAIEQPAEAQVNADWCRGSHLDNPECQPGNSSKVEK